VSFFKKISVIFYLLTRGSSPAHFITIGKFILTELSEEYNL